MLDDDRVGLQPGSLERTLEVRESLPPEPASIAASAAI